MPELPKMEIEIEVAEKPARYQRVLNAFFNTPLAMLPAKIEEIRNFLMLKAAGGDVAPERIAAIQAARRSDGVQMVGRVAVLPVFGAISQRVGMMEEMSGGVGTEAIGASLDSLMADKQVKSIVMVFDSPGGSVFGVQELAEKIRGYRDQKKIVGLADSMAASGAYWLLAQTSEINVTPGGMVGSIGVYLAHLDATKWEEKEGFKTSLIASTPAKVELHPEVPLSEDAQAEMQRMVNQYYGAFLQAVAKGRGIAQAKVEKDFGQGRMVLAKEAVERGMADHVRTLEQVLRRLGATDGPSAAADLDFVVSDEGTATVEVEAAPLLDGASHEDTVSAAPPLGAKLAAARARAVEIAQGT